MCFDVECLKPNPKTLYYIILLDATLLYYYNTILLVLDIILHPISQKCEKPEARLPLISLELFFLFVFM